MTNAASSELEDTDPVSILLSGGPRASLVRDWIVFNAVPSAELLASFWPEALSADHRQTLLSSPLVRRFLDRRLLSLQGDPEWVDWVPSDPVWQLAMLPGSILVKTLLLSAFCGASELLRSTIQGKVLKTLSVAFGRPYLDYATVRYSARKRPMSPEAILTKWSTDPVGDIYGLAEMLATRCFADSAGTFRLRIQNKLAPLLAGQNLATGMAKDEAIVAFVLALSPNAKELPEPTAL